MEYFWDSKAEYLRQTRKLYYNDDYLQFLVTHLWKITKPVNIVDFGCGYGYLGLKLLDMLPSGSTYCGIDKGEKLLSEARELFQHLPYEAEFICADLREIQLDRKYDIAVCHAVLLHMEDPKDVLQRMHDSVVTNGKVICFEPHWISGMSNQFMPAHRQSEIIRLGILQKLYESDLARSGKDGNIGMKIPVLMSELGMKDIDCRVSDKVNFLNPADNNEALYQTLCEEGLDKTPQDKDSFIGNLIARGLSPEEAERQYEAESTFTQYFSQHGTDQYLVYAPSMKITSGTVMRPA